MSEDLKRDILDAAKKELEKKRKNKTIYILKGKDHLNHNCKKRITIYKPYIVVKLRDPRTGNVIKLRQSRIENQD